MDLTQLVNLAEIIGSIAVLVTLVYLALQVRQGNLAQSRETYRAYVADLNSILFTPMTDLEMMALLQKGTLDFDSLSHREQGMINGVWSPLILLSGEIFAARKQAAIDPLMSHQQDVITASFLQMPGMAAWWEYLKPYFNPDYVAHLERLLASPDCPRATHEMLPWYLPDDAVDDAVDDAE
jgi:hypothetical protein